MNAQPAAPVLTADGATGATPWQDRILHRWPSALGLAAAVLLLATGAAEVATLAIAAPAAALCYLAAAALGRPWVAWVSIPAASLVVIAGEMLHLTWWAALGLAGLVLLLIGLLRGAPRPALSAQTAALVGFGVAGVVALALAPRAAVLVAGLALASHSVWDLVYYRRNQVVSRSVAEFCMVLDAPLGLGFIAVALLAG
jgi:hypothetical protein